VGDIVARETPRTRARDYARRVYLPRLRAERRVTERIVLLELLHLLRPDGTANPSAETLARNTGSFRSAVFQALASLEACGVIERVRTRRSNVYRVVVPPTDGESHRPGAPDGVRPELHRPGAPDVHRPGAPDYKGLKGNTREVGALTHVDAAENLSTAPARARKRARCTWQGCCEPAVAALGFGRWRDKLCFLNYCAAHAAEARRLFAVEVERGVAA
jgi:biotin operon repressor